MELLVVVAIISIVLALAAPAVVSLSKANKVDSAGRIVANVLTIARSEAISRRALIRFEIATNWPSDPTNAYRKFTLVLHDAATSTDTQITSWETLPAGTIFERSDPNANGNTAGAYFFNLNRTQSPSLTVAGQSVATAYIEFTPTGSIDTALQSSPVRLRINQGFITGGNEALAGTKNWFDVSVDSVVGRIATARP